MSKEIQQVVILCGGKGTRMREMTETLPKPMVNVGNMPVEFPDDFDVHDSWKI